MRVFVVARRLLPDTDVGATSVKPARTQWRTRWEKLKLDDIPMVARRRASRPVQAVHRVAQNRCARRSCHRKQVFWLLQIRVRKSIVSATSVTHAEELLGSRTRLDLKGAVLGGHVVDKIEELNEPRLSPAVAVPTCGIDLAEALDWLGDVLVPPALHQRDVDVGPIVGLEGIDQPRWQERLDLGYSRIEIPEVP